MAKRTNNINTGKKSDTKASNTVPKAPEVVTNTTDVKSTNNQPVEVLDVNSFTKSMTSTIAEGLDPNRRVDLLKMMHETFRMDPHAATRYNMSQETVDKINSITAIGQLAAMTCEVVYAKNPFAIKMNAAQLENIVSLGETVGLRIDMKALPAPATDGTVEVPSTALSVSDEAKDQIQNEKTIEESKPELDPTKVYDNEDSITKAIQYIFTIHKDSVFAAIDEALTFLRSTRLYAASKAENPDEAKRALESKTIDNWFDDLTNLFKPTLLFNGIGKHMAAITHFTKTPICAFTVLRNASKNKKTGIPTHNDSFIASLTKAIVKWVCQTNINSNQKAIDNLDPEKNKDEVEKCKAAIAHHNETIEYVMNPSIDFARTCIDDLKSSDNGIKNAAVSTFTQIRKSYYSDVDFKNNTFENLNKNLQQYAGIIINLFKDPNERSEEFVESNIGELVPITPTAEGENKTDDKTKKEDDKNQTGETSKKA